MSQHDDAAHSHDDSQSTAVTVWDEEQGKFVSVDEYAYDDYDDSGSFSDYMDDEYEDEHYTDLSDEWLEEGLDEERDAKVSKKARQDSWYW